MYETYFVPALFQQWTQKMIDAAAIRPSMRVLDVACGTGVLTRAVARRVVRPGSVTGLDPSIPMLEVARRLAPQIDWELGRAESLPFADATFGAVVSQFGLMFFADRAAALREMTRVLQAGGLLVTAVWDRLARCPGYTAFVALLERVCGSEIAAVMRLPFSLGDRHALAALFDEAGLRRCTITTHPGVVRFGSVRSWMYINIHGWTFASQLDPGQYSTLMRESERALRPFVQADGSVEFVIAAHIAVACKENL